VNAIQTGGQIIMGEAEADPQVVVETEMDELVE